MSHPLESYLQALWAMRGSGNVPPGVWDYTIGGYQVSLVIRRIAALLLLGAELDASFGQVSV